MWQHSAQPFIICFIIFLLRGIVELIHLNDFLTNVKQAGAELCHGQLKLELDFNYTVCIFLFYVLDSVELVSWTLYV